MTPGGFPASGLADVAGAPMAEPDAEGETAIATRLASVPATSVNCSRCNRSRYSRGLCAACYARTWATSQRIPDDIDESAVIRAVAGDPVPLGRGERIETVRRLTARGLSASQIAAVVRRRERTVTRDRLALRLSEAAS